MILVCMILLDLQIGYITRSQFTRGFPIGLLNENEEDMMLETYAFEKNSININYFKMNTDVNRSGSAVEALVTSQKPVHGQKTRNKYIPIGTEDLLQPNPQIPIPNIQEIKEKIQKSMRIPYNSV
jgi:hypothetical protein